MPLKLNLLEKFGIFRLNEGPAPIIELLEMLSFKAVTAALRIGIFDIIGTGGKQAEEIAADTQCDPRGLVLLLETLVNIGYLTCKRGYYRTAPSTRKWLLTGSPHSIADLFHHFNDMSMRWDYLDESIRDGKPPLMGWEWLDRHPECWNAYHAGLKSSATLISRELLKKIKLPPTASNLLDIGGSHGQYSIELCLSYPKLSCVVYDWAPAEKTALENIASYGLSERIAFRPGDFVTEPIGSGYDVILVFNVIRIFRSDELKPLLRKMRDALSESGMIIIMDHLGHVPRSCFMKANALLIQLEIFNSTEGKTHDRKDVAGWLKETGFADVRDYRLKRSPGLGVITAVKK